MIYDRSLLVKGPKIVVIGGGTGLSTMLRGLKYYTSNITAVVTVSDDGGSSGILREDLGILPPGDIRNCILALANTEPIMERLLQYRFTEGMLKGQNFGNLFLAAMGGITNNFEDAVKKMSDVLAVTGKVLPVTNENVKLCAELEDGFKITGETNIAKHNCCHPGKIRRVTLEPVRVMPVQEVVDVIQEADVIIFGPGSLYTSVIPNLLVSGLCAEIKASGAMKIYVSNVMTQPGETDGYSVSEHIKAIEDHTYKGIIEYCIANSMVLSTDVMEKYRSDGAGIVDIDEENVKMLGVKLIKKSLITEKNSFIRHDSEKLADAIMDLVAETIFSQDKNRIIDYYYAKDRLKNCELNC